VAKDEVRESTALGLPAKSTCGEHPIHYDGAAEVSQYLVKVRIPIASDSGTSSQELPVASAVDTPVHHFCLHLQTRNLPNSDLHAPIYAKGTAAHVSILCSQRRLSNKHCRRYQGLHPLLLRLLQPELTSVTEYVSYPASDLLPTIAPSRSDYMSADTKCQYIKVDMLHTSHLLFAA